MYRGELDDDVGLLLKLANEEGGWIDVTRLERRPITSASRGAFERAVGCGLILRTGAITPFGYRCLSEWLA